ncbi:unnamed protein product [Chrysoparadoxa australica]
MVELWDKDIATTDDPLGQVFIPVNAFAAGLKRKELQVQQGSGIKHKRYYRDGTGPSKLGSLCVSAMLVKDETGAGAQKQDSSKVRVRYSLQEANEYSCTWPADLFRDGRAGQEGAVPVHVAVGFSSLIISPQKEERIKNQQTQIKEFCVGGADKNNGDVWLEVYEHQRWQPWGWGSTYLSHLQPSDPPQFADREGEIGLLVKDLRSLQPLRDHFFSCDWELGPWLYGSNFRSLSYSIERGRNCASKAAAKTGYVRKRLWRRLMKKKQASDAKALGELPESMVPFFAVAAHQSSQPNKSSENSSNSHARMSPPPSPSHAVEVCVYQNQRFQAAAGGWGSSYTHHLLSSDRPEYTDVTGQHHIGSLQDIAEVPGLSWCGGWRTGEWRFAPDFSTFNSKGEDPTLGDETGSLDAPVQPSGVRRRKMSRLMRRSGGFNASTFGAGGSFRCLESGGCNGSGSDVVVQLAELDGFAIVAATDSTLIIKLKSVEEAGGRGASPATLVFGPCNAAKLGSLVMERASLCKARANLCSIWSRMAQLDRCKEKNDDFSSALEEGLTAEACFFLWALEPALAALSAAYNACGYSEDDLLCAEVVWQRWVRLQSYLREMLALCPKPLGMAGAVVEQEWQEAWDSLCLNTMSALERSRQTTSGISSDVKETALAASIRYVSSLSELLDQYISHLVLSSQLMTESTMRKGVALGVTAMHSLALEEINQLIAGADNLDGRESLALLSELTGHRKAASSKKGLCLAAHPRLSLFGWGLSPNPTIVKPAALSKALASYTVSLESKLEAQLKNILKTNEVIIEIPAGEDATRVIELWTYAACDAAITVIPSTISSLLTTYGRVASAQCPNSPEVMAVVLKAASSALVELRRSYEEKLEEVDTCMPNWMEEKLEFFCAASNDCLYLATEGLPDLERVCQERLGRCIQEADMALEVVKELWLELGARSCRKSARVVLNEMEASGLLDDATENERWLSVKATMIDYCLGSVKKWMDEYYYEKFLLKCCDHMVVRVLEDLRRRAIDEGSSITQGELLWLANTRDIIETTFTSCSIGEVSLFETPLQCLRDVTSLLTVSIEEADSAFHDVVCRYPTCQRSLQHCFGAMLELRPDAGALPTDVLQWADEGNFMGADQAALNQATHTQSSSFPEESLPILSRVFGHPISELRRDPELARLPALTVITTRESSQLGNTEVPRRASQPFARGSTTLEVVLLEGEGLRGQKHSIGKAVTYCEVCITTAANKMAKVSKKKQGRSPTYNEAFTFQLTAGESFMEAQLVTSVFEKCSFRDDELIGTVAVPVSSCLRSGRRDSLSRGKWYPLEPPVPQGKKGKIKAKGKTEPGAKLGQQQSPGRIKLRAAAAGASLKGV